MKGVIVVPACNEAVSLEHFLLRLQIAIDEISGSKIDVLVIDDGSTDNTASVVSAGGYRLIQNGQNRGLGHSLRRGYQLAVDEKYDFLVSMDSDGQHDVGFLTSMLELLSSDHELVIASRYHPESKRLGPPLDRDLLNIAFVSIIHATTGWKQVTDPLSGFWAMNRRVAEFLAQNLKLERYGTCLEGLIKLWYLCQPRPTLTEVSHPAIYTNHEGGILNREYSPATLEERLERFRDHALHISSTLDELKAAGLGKEIEVSIKNWREIQLALSQSKDQ